MFVALILATLATGSIMPDAIKGHLDPRDPMLPSGRYHQAFEANIEEGMRLCVRLESWEFDPLLIVTGPHGRRLESDDHQNSPYVSQVVWIADQSGPWTVIVSSARPGESGNFSLRISEAAVPPPEPLPMAPIDPIRAPPFIARSIEIEAIQLSGNEGAWSTSLALRSGMELAIATGPLPGSGTPDLQVMGPSGITYFRRGDHRTRTSLSLQIHETGDWTIVIQGSPHQEVWFETSVFGPVHRGIHPNADLCSSLSYAVADAHFDFHRTRADTAHDAGFESSHQLPTALGSWVTTDEIYVNRFLDAPAAQRLDAPFLDLLGTLSHCLPGWQRRDEPWCEDPLATEGPREARETVFWSPEHEPATVFVALRQAILHGPHARQTVDVQVYR